MKGSVRPDSGASRKDVSRAVEQAKIGHFVESAWDDRAKMREQQGRLSPIPNVRQSAVRLSAARLPLERRLLIFVLALSLIGFVVHLLATRWSIGVNYDSVAYIATARYFLTGRGYPSWLFPPSHWPPLLPGVLALIGASGLDPAVGIRWLHAALFAANIALVGMIVGRYRHGAIWAAALASFLMLSSQDMLLIHSMAWSEPLFICLTLLAILFTAEYLDRPVPAYLAAATAAAAGAFLTRYVGGTVIVAGALGLLLLDDRPPSRRVLNAALFAAIAALPTVLWMLANVHAATPGVAAARTIGASSVTADRVVTTHLISFTGLGFGLQTAATWLLPKRAPDRGIVFLVLLGVVVGAAATRWIGKGGRAPFGAEPARRLTRLPALLVLFILAYLGLLLGAISFIDRAVLDQRTLSPVFVAGLTLLCCWIANRWGFRQTPRPVRAGIMLLAIYLVTLYAVRGVQYTVTGYRDGLATTRREWRNAEIVRDVRVLPSGILVYSNFPDLVYILAGRDAARLPEKVDYVSGLRNRYYSTQLMEMRHVLQRGKAVIVEFTLFDYEKATRHTGDVVDLMRAIPLTVVRQTEDGAIYRLRGAPIEGLE